MRHFQRTWSGVWWTSFTFTLCQGKLDKLRTSAHFESSIPFSLACYSRHYTVPGLRARLCRCRPSRGRRGGEGDKRLCTGSEWPGSRLGQISEWYFILTESFPMKMMWPVDKGLNASTDLSKNWFLIKLAFERVHNRPAQVSCFRSAAPRWAVLSRRGSRWAVVSLGGSRWAVVSSVGSRWAVVS